MAFLNKQEVCNFEKEKYQKAMEDWADKNPFCFEMMFGNMTFEEKLRYAEEGLNPSSS